MYALVRKGAFDKFGAIPTQGFSEERQQVKIPKQVVFALYQSLFE